MINGYYDDGKQWDVGTACDAAYRGEGYITCQSNLLRIKISHGKFRTANLSFYLVRVYTNEGPQGVHWVTSTVALSFKAVEERKK